MCNQNICNSCEMKVFMTFVGDFTTSTTFHYPHLQMKFTGNKDVMLFSSKYIEPLISSYMLLVGWVSQTWG